MRPRTDGSPMWYRSHGSQPTIGQNAPIPTRPRLAGLQPDAHVTIVRVGGLGDTILILPTLAILREAFPNATFTLVGSMWAEALQPLVPFAARTVHIDRVFPPARHGGHLANVFAESSAVIVYTATSESDFVSYVRRACPGAVPIWPVGPAAGIHAARHLANVVASVPSDPDALPMPTLQCPREDCLQARGWLDQEIGHGVHPIAVHPGSGGKWKCWPAQQFAELAARLQVPVLLVEGPADADACREFAEALASSVPVARATGVSLSRLAALLAESRGYVGNDSGVSHLAAALGVPTVAVFGPTDPAVWAPLGPKVSVVTARGDAPWPTVDAVLAAARKLFDDWATGACA